jgi:hypothetical protein
MYLLHAARHPKTWGLNCRTDLIDPHATTMDAAKISARNRATMVVDREVVAKGTPNGGSHEDNRANDDLGSSYSSDGEDDTHHDKRYPGKRLKPVPRAARGDPCDLVGPPVFGYQIRSAPTPYWFRAPNIEKYDGEIDPKIWLVNYQLAMKATSALDTFFMI